MISLFGGCDRGSRTCVVCLLGDKINNQIVGIFPVARILGRQLKYLHANVELVLCGCIAIPLIDESFSDSLRLNRRGNASCIDSIVIIIEQLQHYWPVTFFASANSSNKKKKKIQYSINNITVEAPNKHSLTLRRRADDGPPRGPCACGYARAHCNPWRFAGERSGYVTPSSRRCFFFFRPRACVQCAVRHAARRAFVVTPFGSAAGVCFSLVPGQVFANQGVAREFWLVWGTLNQSQMLVVWLVRRSLVHLAGHLPLHKPSA